MGLVGISETGLTKKAAVATPKPTARADAISSIKRMRRIEGWFFLGQLKGLGVSRREKSAGGPQSGLALPPRSPPKQKKSSAIDNEVQNNHSQQPCGKTISPPFFKTPQLISNPPSLAWRLATFVPAPHSRVRESHSSAMTPDNSDSVGRSATRTSR